MNQPNVVVAKASRSKDRQYKRQHKAARLRVMLEERAAAEKAAAALDRKLGRSIRRAEAAFDGCEV